MKNFILALLTTISAIYQPAQAMFATILGLVLVDLVTGILAARKRGESLRSAGIGRTVLKLLIYELTIALAFPAEIYLTGPLIPVSKVAASLIGTTELLSVLENLNTVSGGDLLKTIIDKISQIGKQ